MVSAAARSSSERISAAALARVADPPGSISVRVEYYLTALGAITGEAAIVAAGIDIETLDMAPMSRRAFAAGVSSA